MRKAPFISLASIALMVAQNAVAIAPIFSSGNPSNDKLLDMPDNGQAAMLSKATQYQCLGKKPFYMGTESSGLNRGVAFWSLTCDNGGKKYMIVIAPDPTGSTRIFDCDHLRDHFRPHPPECYSKIKQ